MELLLPYALPAEGTVEVGAVMPSHVNGVMLRGVAERAVLLLASVSAAVSASTHIQAILTRSPSQLDPQGFL